MSTDQVVGQELEWRQPRAGRRLYELTEAGRGVAALRFQSVCGSLAAGEYGSGKWTFKRTGFLSPRISVRAEGSDTDIATFTPGWMGGGWIVFGWGRRYQLRQSNFWGTQWTFQGEDGKPAITLSARQGFLKEGGLVTVAPSAQGLTETPVLLLLIWYVRVLMNEDASAAATAAVTAACT